MARSYFELDSDNALTNTWFLDKLVDAKDRVLDSRDLTYGVPVDLKRLKLSLDTDGTIVDVVQPLHLSIATPGTPLEFSFAGLSMPVVSASVAEALSLIAPDDIQLIPVTVVGDKQPYMIVNIISVIDCIDKTNSEIQWYEEGNPVRPDLVGSPEMITKLVIDSVRVGGHHVFRPAGWTIAVIVSEGVRDYLRPYRHRQKRCHEFARRTPVLVQVW